MECSKFLEDIQTAQTQSSTKDLYNFSRFNTRFFTTSDIIWWEECTTYLTSWWTTENKDLNMKILRKSLKCLNLMASTYPTTYKAILKFVLQNCKNSTLKHFIETPILNNFVTLSIIPRPRLHYEANAQAFGTVSAKELFFTFLLFLKNYNLRNFSLSIGQNTLDIFLRKRLP